MALRRKNEQRQSPLIYNRIVLGVVIVIFIIFGVSAGELLVKEHDTKQSLRAAVAEKDTVFERKKSLEKALVDIESPRGKETVLRHSFDVAKEGEEVIILLDRDSVPEEIKDESIWGWIKSLF